MCCSTLADLACTTLQAEAARLLLATLITEALSPKAENVVLPDTKIYLYGHDCTDRPLLPQEASTRIVGRRAARCIPAWWPSAGITSPRR